MDKLDEMKRKSDMHSNLIKWWDVKMIPLEDEKQDEINDEHHPEDEMLDFDVLDDSSRDLASRILTENSNSNAFDKAYSALEIDEINRRHEEANEIFERLMREAAEDEAKKQQEIEAAKLLANG